jgi:hypothetical protein
MSTDGLIVVDGGLPWESQKEAIIELLSRGTVAGLRNRLKQIGFTGKVDKVKKQDLIDEFIALKHKEWHGLTKHKPQMTSLKQAREATKKRKNWDRDDEHSQQAEQMPQKRARLPAFLEKKEREASENREASSKRESTPAKHPDKREASGSRQKDKAMLFKDVIDISSSEPSRPGTQIKPRAKQEPK